MKRVRFLQEALQKQSPGNEAFLQYHKERYGRSSRHCRSHHMQLSENGGGTVAHISGTEGAADL